jgi:hypothetical protein
MIFANFAHRFFCFGNPTLLVPDAFFLAVEISVIVILFVLIGVLIEDT